MAMRVWRRWGGGAAGVRVCGHACMQHACALAAARRACPSPALLPPVPPWCGCQLAHWEPRGMQPSHALQPPYELQLHPAKPCAMDLGDASITCFLIALSALMSKRCWLCQGP